MNEFPRFYIMLCAPVLALCVTEGDAATLLVDLNGAGEFTDVQSAIDAAQDGDTVLVKPGTYLVIGPPISFNGKAITVRSEAGPDLTVIRPLVQGFRTGSAISGLTLTGGIFVGDGQSPEIQDCAIPGGVWSRGASPILKNCTIAENSGPGVQCEDGSSLTLTSCILWDNSGGSISKDDASTVTATFSCIEGSPLWPGMGNLNVNPRFCGWPGTGTVYVDASRLGPGSGSVDDPYANLRLALAELRLGLQAASPCIGTGEAGSDMGANLAGCADGGSETLVVHLAPGRYGIRGLSLAGHVSLLGAGQDSTVIEGEVRGLRTGAVLSAVTLLGRGTFIAGGLWIHDEAPEIRDCLFSGDGGNGVNISNNASPKLINCILSDGPVSCYSSSPTLTNCIISGNWAGVICDHSSPTLSNCIISGNRGNGVECRDSSSPSLTNCTIVGNLRFGVSGGSSSTLTNCIVWDNASGAIEQGDTIISYSCIDSGWPGDGNTDQDPLFVQPGYWQDPNTWIPGDYHLQSGSPCIDTGTCDGAALLDNENNVRPAGAGCDMGAYELGSMPPAPPEFTGAGFTPAQGPEGTTVTLMGSHFTGATIVTFKGVGAAFIVSSAVSIDAIVPPGATTGPITVVTPWGSATSADAFSVLPRSRFRRGDTNADTKADISDAITTLGFHFLGTPEQLACDKAADVNDDGKVDMSDPIALLNHLFSGAAAPPAPFGGCGLDPTEDELQCEAGGPCV